LVGVAGGLAAALLWGISGFAAARSTRILGAAAALAWVYIVGLATAIVAISFTHLPSAGAGAIAWNVVGDATAVTSLYTMYAAVRHGPVVLVMPICAAQGAVAALLGVASGETVGALGAAGIVLTVVGLYGAMRSPRAAAARADPKALGFAAASALTAGLALFASTRAGASLGTAWTVASLRTAGVLGVTAPLALRGGFRLPRSATPYVVFSGLADTGGLASYVWASTRAGVIVPAVLGSQYAAVSALLGMVALGERPTRLQLGGVCAILAGVAIVTAAQS
jgi:drug/metabolite transporter (DMT)-like permease